MVYKVGTSLDGGEEGIGLRLGKTVALVEQKVRPSVEHFEGIPRLLHRLFDVGDPRADGVEFDEIGIRLGGDDVGERRLSAPRGAPEDTAAEAVERDGAAKERPFRDDVLLPYEIFEAGSPHPFGERLRVLFIVVEIEKIHLVWARCAPSVCIIVPCGSYA